MLLCALSGLLAVGVARAFEGDENPFQIGAPPQPFYAPDQRIFISDPDDGSVLTRSPSRITVNFRRFNFDLDPSSLELWVDGVERTRELRFWTDVAWLDLPVGSELSSGEHVIMTRIQDHGGFSYSNSVAIAIIFPSCPGGCPWPFTPTNEAGAVANLMEDWQDFHSTPYFHSGLDIRADAGTPIRSCTAGTVVNVYNYPPAGALKWGIMVRDVQGYVWQYHHVDHNTITVSIGDPVSQGQVLGNVVPWTVMVNGYYYHHVHLNVTRWYGIGPIGYPYVDGWIYYNPLNFLNPGGYVESLPPDEFEIYFADNESNTPFVADTDLGTPLLSGNLDVIAWLRDHRTLAPPTEGQPYELGLYDLAYSIVPVNTPCGMGFLPRTRLARFDAVPGGKIVSTQEKVLKTIYKPIVNYSGVSGTHYNYADQEFFYTLTNTHNGYPDGPNGSWNTAQAGGLGPLYPDGTYIVKSYARDIDGNETVTPVTVVVQNGQTYSGICPPYVIDWRWIQSLKLQSQSGSLYSSLPPAMPIEFGPMVDGSAHATRDGSSWPVWYFDLPDRGVRVGIGLLAGRLAQVEYVPLLGDVIVEADAEAQVLPPGGLFDPALPASQPVPLHITTRLVRDPATGAPLIGRPADYGAATFKLVMNALILVQGEPMTLRAGSDPGSNAGWVLEPVAVGPAAPVVAPGVLTVKAAPNPFVSGGTLRLTLDRQRDVVVEVFDAGGRRVRQLLHGPLAAGETIVRWDGRDAMGGRLPAGIYLVHVRGGDVEARAKLALMN